MALEKDFFVACSYKLTTQSPDGPIDIETATPEAPLEFIFGSDSILEHFQNQLKDLNEGDTFRFTLTPDQAYGEADPDFIVSLEREIFVDDKGNFDAENVVVGNTLPMSDNEGHQLFGIVRSLNDTHVEVDFNHPLAGQTLNYEGQIISAHPASDEERARIEAYNSADWGGCDCGCGCGNEHNGDSCGCSGCAGGCR